MPDAKAEALKNEGNKFFKAGKYPEAIAKYKKATAIDASETSYWSNMAAFHEKLGEFKEMQEAARQCILADENFIKGYFRLAVAQKALNDLPNCIKTLESGLGIEANNADLKKMKKEVAKLQRAEHVAAYPKVSTNTIEDELWKKVIALEKAMKGIKMEMVDVRNENKKLQQELDKLRPDVASSSTLPPTVTEGQATVVEAQSTTPNNGNTTDQAQTTPGFAVTGNLTYYMGNKAMVFPANSFDPHALVIVQIANSWFQQKMNAAFPNAGPTFDIQDDYTTTLISKELGFLNADNRFIISINAILTFSSPSAPSLETINKFFSTNLNTMELARPTNERLNPANPGNWFSIPFCNVLFHYRVTAK